MKYNVLSGIEVVPVDPIVMHYRLKSMIEDTKDLCTKYIKSKPQGKCNGSNTKSSKSK